MAEAVNSSGVMVAEQGLLERVLAFASSLNPIAASFVVSLVFNSIPYAAIPYLIVIAGYAATIEDTLTKLLVAVSGGLGAAIGKLIVFYFGRGIHRILSEQTRENLELFAKVFSKGVFVAVFLFAALPLPDDVLYIPLGVAGYNPVLFFTAVALGKIVLTGLAVLFGGIVGEVSGGSGVMTVVALALGSALVTIIISRMDWRHVINVYNEYGIVAAFIEMIVQFFAAMMPRRYGRLLVERIDSLVLPRLARLGLAGGRRG